MSDDKIFVSGGVVFYKYTGQCFWTGPAILLKKDGLQVLVIVCGGFYVCCHPCRLTFDHNTSY